MQGILGDEEKKKAKRANFPAENRGKMGRQEYLPYEMGKHRGLPLRKTGGILGAERSERNFVAEWRN